MQRVQALEYVGLIGENISFAWVPEGGALQNLISYSGVHLYSSVSPPLPACEETFVELGRLIVPVVPLDAPAPTAPATYAEATNPNPVEPEPTIGARY